MCDLCIISLKKIIKKLIYSAVVKNQNIPAKSKGSTFVAYAIYVYILKKMHVTRWTSES